MDAVVRRWLRPPFELDGWRVDVANMTGRLGAVDVNRRVAEAVRRGAEATRADALVVAEHGHDFRPDLRPGGWHGTMNYSGFLRPSWFWLQPGTLETDPFSEAPAPRYDSHQAVATMRAFRAGVAWASTLHSWTLLGSHDTPRVATVTGSRERQLVGVGLSMTTPGVPMVFAGDELGLQGDWPEDGRRTMPWDARERWDAALLDGYRRLIAIRRSSEALATGGLRYARVDGDVIAYLREAPGERLLCVASRAAHAPLRLPLTALECAELEPLYGPEAEVAGEDALVPAEGPAFGIWKLS
jgi:alpha-glucosidase